jgi:short-subunit dehydrogenase
VAVLTGTSSGIGEAVATTLLAQGWCVHGIARRPARFDSEHYFHSEVDLTDTRALTSLVEHIRAKHSQITALINNAGVGYFAPHEELSTSKIEEMVHLNLLAPLLLSKLLLRDLKSAKGFLINVSSFSAHESSSFGAAYAATKAGLRHFSNSLFDEARKSGLKVCTISPDITRTHFHDTANFAPEDDQAAAVEPQCVAETVLNILTQRQGTVVTEVVLRPQRLLLKKR